MSNGTSLTILAEPCEACPFTGRFASLRAGRLKDIVETCEADDSYFVCHRTVDYAHEELDTDAVFGNAKVCAGWLHAAENRGRTPAIVQIAQRLGLTRMDEAKP